MLRRADSQELSYLYLCQAWMVTLSGSCTYSIQYTPMVGNLIYMQCIQNQRNNGSDFGLALTRRQAIIWTNSVPWRTIWRFIEPNLSRLFMDTKNLKLSGGMNRSVWRTAYSHIIGWFDQDHLPIVIAWVDYFIQMTYVASCWCTLPWLCVWECCIRIQLFHGQTPASPHSLRNSARPRWPPTPSREYKNQKGWSKLGPSTCIAKSSLNLHLHLHSVFRWNPGWLGLILYSLRYVPWARYIIALNSYSVQACYSLSVSSRRHWTFCK